MGEVRLSRAHLGLAVARRISDDDNAVVPAVLARRDAVLIVVRRGAACGESLAALQNAGRSLAGLQVTAGALSSVRLHLGQLLPPVQPLREQLRGFLRARDDAVGYTQEAAVGGGEAVAVAPRLALGLTLGALREAQGQAPVAVGVGAVGRAHAKEAGVLWLGPNGVVEGHLAGRRACAGGGGVLLVGEQFEVGVAERQFVLRFGFLLRRDQSVTAGSE